MMQVIYNTFVWMQLFNEINCRRIFNEINMFKGILNNWFFLGIWLFSAIVQVPCIARARASLRRASIRIRASNVTCTSTSQVTSVQFGGDVFHTVPLDAYDWVACIAVGAFSLGA
jgi:magnesium-transporting ATPase (P-type)